MHDAEEHYIEAAAEEAHEEEMLEQLWLQELYDQYLYDNCDHDGTDSDIPAAQCDDNYFIFLDNWRAVDLYAKNEDGTYVPSVIQADDGEQEGELPPCNQEDACLEATQVVDPGSAGDTIDIWFRMPSGSFHARASPGQQVGVWAAVALGAAGMPSTHWLCHKGKIIDKEATFEDIMAAPKDSIEIRKRRPAGTRASSVNSALSVSLPATSCRTGTAKPASRTRSCNTKGSIRRRSCEPRVEASSRHDAGTGGRSGGRSELRGAETGHVSLPDGRTVSVIDDAISLGPSSPTPSERSPPCSEAAPIPRGPDMAGGAAVRKPSKGGFVETGVRNGMLCRSWSCPDCDYVYGGPSAYQHKSRHCRSWHRERFVPFDPSTVLSHLDDDQQFLWKCRWCSVGVASDNDIVKDMSVVHVQQQCRKFHYERNHRRREAERRRAMHNPAETKQLIIEARKASRTLTAQKHRLQVLVRFGKVHNLRVWKKLCKRGAHRQQHYSCADCRLVARATNIPETCSYNRKVQEAYARRIRKVAATIRRNRVAREEMLREACFREGHPIENFDEYRAAPRDDAPPAMVQRPQRQHGGQYIASRGCWDQEVVEITENIGQWECPWCPFKHMGRRPYMARTRHLRLSHPEMRPRKYKRDDYMTEVSATTCGSASSAIGAFRRT